MKLSDLHPESYADCVFCGGEVLPVIRDYESWVGKELVVIRNVPLGVCSQCHERYIYAKVGVQIDRILDGAAGEPRTREIPEYNMADLAKAA